MTICFLDTVGLPYTGDTLSLRGLGGSESAVILLSKELASLNLDVTVYNKCEKEGKYNNVQYLDISRIKDNSKKFDILICSRSCLPYAPSFLWEEIKNRYNVIVENYLPLINNSFYKVVWMHDTFCPGDEYLEAMAVDGYFHELFTLSDWHTSYISTTPYHSPRQRRYDVLKEKIFQTRNGIVSYMDEVDIFQKDKNSFIYNASFTKGLEGLVTTIWKRVRERIPDAKLTIIGGYYSGANNGNPDEQEIKYWELYKNNNNKNGITFAGVIKQKEIAEILTKATFFIYPEIFPETFGISTLEAINYNVILLGCRFGALEEIADESVSYKINYPIDWDDRQIDRFLDMVVKAYEDDFSREQKMYACNAFKPWISWKAIAYQWKEHLFRKLGLFLPLEEIKVVREINSKLLSLFNRRHINEEEKLVDYSLDKRHKIGVVVTVYNAEKYISNCIKSITSQLYNEYKLYILDDASTDNTLLTISTVVSLFPIYLREKIIIIKNSEHTGSALGNQIRVLEDIIDKDTEVILLVDGDDWLINDPDVFNIINHEYHYGAEMTYGSCHSLVDNINLIAQPYPKDIHKEKAYRSYKFRWGIPFTHLRTFKMSLYNKVNKDKLKNEKGEYYKAGGDGALIYALLEACDDYEKIKVIQKVLYIYNDTNPLNDYKINSEEQTLTANKIQSLINKKEIKNTINSSKIKEISNMIIEKNQSSQKIYNILLALPTAKNIETNTFLSIYRLILPSNIKVHMECFYGYRIDQVRNLIVDYSIRNNFDYLFCVDSDIILPPDALVSLLESKQDIVSGLYVQRRQEEMIPEVYEKTSTGGLKNIDFKTIPLNSPQLISIAGCGFGCVLLSQKVLTTLKYPHFEYHPSIDFKGTVSEDVDFCIKATQAGFPIYLNSKVLCDHISSSILKCS